MTIILNVMMNIMNFVEQIVTENNMLKINQYILNHMFFNYHNSYYITAKIEIDSIYVWLADKKIENIERDNIDIYEQAKDRKYWKQISYNVAVAGIQMCATALTIPEYEYDTNYNTNDRYSKKVRQQATRLYQDFERETSRK